MKRVISFDGGGVRGLISARVLDRLAKQYPQFWRSADILAGTSTGAIMAAGLASGLSATDLADFYQSKSSTIFKDPILHKVESLDSFVEPKYANKDKRKVLEEILGNKKTRRS